MQVRQALNSKLLLCALILTLAVVLNWLAVKRFFAESWMRFDLRNDNIVVTFTTTPYRINKLAPTLKTIIAQNIPHKTIYLNVPYKFKRDNLDYVIPQWLTAIKEVNILRTNDYGPATKLLGVLEKLDLAPGTIIITVDDDVYYPKNFFLNLAYRAKHNPNCAVGISGVKFDRDANGEIPIDSANGLLKVTPDNALVSVLEGFGGIAYRRKFFDNSIFDIVNAPRECINSDDLYISFYLAEHNVPRIVLANDFVSFRQIKWEESIGMQNDALHKITRPTDRHRACDAYLHSKDPNVAFE